MRSPSPYSVLSNKRIRSTAITTFLVLALLYWVWPTWTGWLAEPQKISPPSNATLGFGAIYVLTEDANTWRVQGLRKAADLTGLRLTIPVQRHLTDDQVQAHLSGDVPKTDLNEIRALLNYIALLEAFLRTGYETALIVEDDVDFGVNIKAQMEAISESILTHGFWVTETDAMSLEGEVPEGQYPRYPYGGEWDIFWLGHFGIEFSHSTESWLYNDPHALPWARLKSEFNEYYTEQAESTAFHGKPEVQQLHRRIAPMASYSFAVTRAAAEKLIERLRKEKSQRFDLSLHRDCKGLRLVCLAPVPEVMHHQQVEGGESLGKSSESLGDRKHDLNWWRTRHKYTYNVEWSARCNAANSGVKVGERWQCIPSEKDPFGFTNKNQIE